LSDRSARKTEPTPFPPPVLVVSPRFGPPARLQRDHGHPKTSATDNAIDAASRAVVPLHPGLGPDGRRSGLLLVLPALARNEDVRYRTGPCPHGLVEGGLAAVPVPRGVGSVHSLEVSGLLRLVGYATDAIPRGSADHARGPGPDGERIPPERGHWRGPR